MVCSTHSGINLVALPNFALFLVNIAGIPIKVMASILLREKQVLITFSGT
jgi:hypothetical protein